MTTPRPWFVAGVDSTRKRMKFIIEADGIVCTPHAMSENCAFLSRAVNEHDALVSSLKETLEAARMLTRVVFEAGLADKVQMGPLNGFGVRAQEVLGRLPEGTI